MDSSMSMGGREVEKSSFEFQVGKAFTSEHRAGTFEGLVKWVPFSSAEGEGQIAATRTLLLERRFEVKGQKVTLEEHLTPTSQGRLSVRTVVKGIGALEVPVQSVADRDLLCGCLDQRLLRLKKEAVISGVQVWR